MKCEQAFKPYETNQLMYAEFCDFLAVEDLNELWKVFIAFM